MTDTMTSNNETEQEHADSREAPVAAWMDLFRRDTYVCAACGLIRGHTVAAFDPGEPTRWLVCEDCGSKTLHLELGELLELAGGEPDLDLHA